MIYTSRSLSVGWKCYWYQIASACNILHERGSYINKPVLWHNAFHPCGDQLQDFLLLIAKCIFPLFMCLKGSTVICSDLYIQISAGWSSAKAVHIRCETGFIVMQKVLNSHTSLLLTKVICICLCVCVFFFFFFLFLLFKYVGLKKPKVTAKKNVLNIHLVPSWGYNALIFYY